MSTVPGAAWWADRPVSLLLRRTSAGHGDEDPTREGRSVASRPEVAWLVGRPHFCIAAARRAWLLSGPPGDLFYAADRHAGDHSAVCRGCARAATRYVWLGRRSAWLAPGSACRRGAPSAGGRMARCSGRSSAARGEEGQQIAITRQPRWRSPTTDGHRRNGPGGLRCPSPRSHAGPGPAQRG